MDPRLARSLDELFAAERLSRRRFLGRAGGTGLALSSLPALLAACGGGDEDGDRGRVTPSPTAVSHPKTRIGDWTFANWPLYVDKRTITDFDERFGGECHYVEEINGNFEFFDKVRSQLEAKRPIGRDMVVLTDFLASRWVRLGYCEPLDKRNIPNASNLVEGLKTINYDPGREFTLPWQSGAIGLGYNPRKTGREIKSIGDLFDPKFKGRVTMLSEAYDSAGTVLLGDGDDPSQATVDQLLGAIEKIDKAKRGGQFLRFTGNDYTEDLAKGDAWISLAYSGDLVQLQSDNPELRLAYPEEGAVLFTDNMMLPAKAEHFYAAEAMMNYVYEPEVAARIAAAVNYIPPVAGVHDILAKEDPKLAENPLIFPSDEIRAKLKPYPVLSPADERTMLEAMDKVIGG
jgi:spermidine/putrescine transport system substrate-binding protein